MKFVCQICGYIYDEAKENLAFDQLPDSWVCPLCKAAKSAFAAEGKEENDRKEGEKEPVQQEEILTESGIPGTVFWRTVYSLLQSGKGMRKTVPV